MDLDIAQWFLNPRREIINKGALVEAFVGQELLAYSSPHIKSNAYYWHREGRLGQAEIDYLLQVGAAVIPVEVKSGSGKTLKSLQTFLDSHIKSPYALRFSAQNYSVYNKIYSYPLYAIFQVMSDKNADLKQAIRELDKKVKKSA